MGQALSIISHTHTYFSGLLHFTLGRGRWSEYSVQDCTFSRLQIKDSDSSDEALFKQHARIHLFSLASNFYLYNRPHYRKGSYRDDLVDNLRNVAIPGSGIPLSMFVRSRVVALGFLLTAYPAISFVASAHKWIKSKFQSSLSEEYATRLLVSEIFLLISTYSLHMILLIRPFLPCFRLLMIGFFFGD